MKVKERMLNKNNMTSMLEKTTKQLITNSQISRSELSKKKSLQEKGITLIALVVTIIILLILAGVTLNMALSQNGLFSKTQEAADKYKQAQSDEEDLILKYEYEMAKMQGEISETKTVGEYAMEKEIKEKYKQDIKIGDTVNYDPNISGDGYDGTWKVLGIEDGKILLMSSKPVQEDYEILGVEGYVNGEKYLDDICSKYGEGEGATSARSLRVEDINKITGYNPNRSDKFRKGTIKEYGIEVTLKKNDEGQIEMIGSNGVKEIWKTDNFKYIDEDGKEKEFDGELTIKNEGYEYVTSTGKNWYAEMGHPTRANDGSWGKLFGDYSEETWLANKLVFVSNTADVDKGPILHLYRCLGVSGTNNNFVSVDFIYEEKSTSVVCSKDVSCVVVLEDSVSFETESEGEWDIK